ncbi:DNA methylase, N-6 adenine-specific, conserved site [Penicillium camemberti]|uniref:aromatic-amino-acid transaminase n=1 Tax=Penicillium camemberti (strain FM 013) TaxID=1429867 RepID=A0A0G4PMQ1_PENC3|nr:DNA methylase, N-6 adenine-specific, conserved site [Penicillium camemberti]
MSTRQASSEVDELPNLQPKRKVVDPSQWAVAAPCTSEQFKTRRQQGKPTAREWNHYLSSESTSRTGSTLKSAFKHLKTPGMISLGGGLPLSDYFPFESLSLTVSSPEKPSPKNSDSNDANAPLHASKSDINQGRSIYDLSVALNYSQGSGSAQFLRWITEHTEIVHDPPYADWQCTMTVGNTSALDMALRMFTQPGDYVLSDEYTFATAMETAKPMGVKFTGVKMDKEGMRPDSLRQILEGWDPKAHGNSRKPFLLYSIPTGQNPTGATQSLERRRDIYRIAQEHDLIILEDDPYYFLQMNPFSPAETRGPTGLGPQTPAELLKVLVPSYLSMDTDGRVVRMDSFSKVVSPGVRLGWLTAPQQVIEQYKNHSDVSTQGPGGLSQLALFKLLDEHWGHAGYLEWLTHIRNEYTDRRDFMIRACERYLPRTVTSWEPAQAGMFQWLAVDWTKHPDANIKSALQIEEEIWLKAISNGALVACGSWFCATGNSTCNEVFYRTTFAAATLDQIEQAVMRLGEALKTCFHLVDTIE